MPLNNLATTASAISEVNIKKGIRTAKFLFYFDVATTSRTILLNDENRATYSIYNHGPGNVYITEGLPPSLTSFEYKLPPGFYYEPNNSNDLFTGDIFALSDSQAFLSVGVATWETPSPLLPPDPADDPNYNPPSE
jgi:hypothetical protein